MNKNAITSALSIALLTLSLTADTVDNAEIVTFVAGDPACAADVNQTIQELISAINDNNAQIAALEARVVALETTPTLLSIVSGSSYTVYSHEVGIGASSDTDGHGILNSFLGAETAIYTLESNGDLTVSYDYSERFTALRANHHQLDPAFLDGQNQEGVSQVVLDNDVIDNGSGSDTEGNWSLSGSTLTVNWDGDTEEFLVSPDGNMILSGAAELDDEALTPGGPLLTNSDIVIGIRAIAEVE